MLGVFFSLNTNFTYIPFLLSLKSDAARYLWFDWQSRWSSIEVQPSSIAKYSLAGLPYSSKKFEYTSALGDELADAEKLSKEKPFREDFSENDRIIIEDGPLKGHITKILSLSANERVNVLINILGSLKEIQIPKNIIKKI